MGERSPTLAVRVRGPYACFTRPEAKVERFSYEVMTPSAARGIVEAILWKPAIRWHIERIHVLKPIRFAGFRRNEVSSKVPAAGPRSPAHGLAGEPLDPFYADEERQQRHTIALREVDYLIEAFFELTDKAHPDDTIPKFVEMFQRRVEKGQYFTTPYLGCREFAAEIREVHSRGDAHFDALTQERLRVAQEASRPLGYMLLDLEVGRDGRRKPQFFRAALDRGRLVEEGRSTLPFRGGTP